MTTKISKTKKSEIILVAQGGLANRMRAIASSYYYAEKLNRKLTVVWYRNKDLNASFGELFETENLPFKILEPNSLSFYLRYEEPRKKNLYISAFINKILKKQHIKSIHLESEEGIFKILNEFDDDIIIHSGSQFADFDRELLISIFRFSEKVYDTSYQILKGLQPTLCLQIRRTDNSQSIVHSPLEAFEKVVKKHLQEDNKTLFFLATDDTETKKYFSKKYPENFVVNPREARRDTPEGMIDGAAEMFIMSNCKVIYGSFWSSFSEIASMYGNNKLIVVKDS